MTSVAVLLSLVFYECAHSALYTNHWAVEMHGSGDVEAAANELAAKHGFRNLGKVPRNSEPIGIRQKRDFFLR